MNDDDETATIGGRNEHAAKISGTVGRERIPTELIKRRVRMLRAGVPCERCRRGQAVRLVGSPTENLMALCAICAENRDLDQRVARQRSTRESMRRRGAR